MTIDTDALPLVHRTAAARVGSPPYPALVLLHGLGSDEHDLLGFVPHIDPRLFVVSVRAPHPHMDVGYAWYDLAEGYGPTATLSRSLALVERFLAGVADAYPIDGQRVYLGGFSQGAAITLATVVLHPARIAGAIALSGYLPPHLAHQPTAANGMPIFQGHGTFDQVVPIEAARRTRDVLSAMPVALTYREYPVGHEVSAPELLELNGWLGGLLGDRYSR